jgi:protein-disulfide isomerase
MRMNARRLLLLAALCAGLIGLLQISRSQEQQPPTPADGSTLPLPKGTNVAIVVFEDLQCPDCARAHPGLLAAAARNKVPLVIYDFPITRHQWAFPAAVMARYFASLSPALGTEFRSFIFEHQQDITPENLREYCERFAREHRVELPANVNPEGKLSAQVQADFDLGKSIGLKYVPLIFVIGPGKGAAHFVEVTDLSQMDAEIARMKGAAAR